MFFLDNRIDSSGKVSRTLYPFYLITVSTIAAFFDLLHELGSSALLEQSFRPLHTWVWLTHFPSPQWNWWTHGLGGSFVAADEKEECDDIRQPAINELMCRGEQTLELVPWFWKTLILPEQNDAGVDASKKRGIPFLGDLLHCQPYLIAKSAYLVPFIQKTANLQWGLYV